MNLFELKRYVDRAIESAEEYGEDPREIQVSIQIDDSLWTNDIELTYDNDCQASGCVLHGWTK